jgi:glycosyltransferase involved in cell wall biosynthesis
VTAHIRSDRLSVVIPTFNRPERLAAALASVAAQTRRPDLVVVADVGAGSWSEAAARSFSERTGLACLPTTCPPPSSPGATRNHGAATITDGWIAFLDDDDTWDPVYLANATASASDVDLVATRIRLRRGERVDPLPALPQMLQAQDFLSRNPGVTGSSIMVTANAFHRIGGFDDTLASFNDMDFLIRALDAGLRSRVVQMPLVEQAIHPDGQATSASDARLRALHQFAERYTARMSPSDRRRIRRERHRIQKRTAATRAGRLGHLAADIALTPPRELLERARRRRRLGGSYE